MANNFTPEQIEQFLQEFFTVVGRRQYIGARYVPLFGRKGESTIEWDNLAPYEPITVVTHQGMSYTSRTYVPTGIDIHNTDYWAATGNYDSQVEQYREEVLRLSEQVETFQDSIDGVSEVIPADNFDNVNTVKKYVDDSTSGVYDALGGDFTESDTVKEYVDAAVANIESTLGIGFGPTNTVKQYIDEADNDINNKIEAINSHIEIEEMGLDVVVEHNDTCYAQGGSAFVKNGIRYYALPLKYTSTDGRIEIYRLDNGDFINYLTIPNGGHYGSLNYVNTADGERLFMGTYENLNTVIEIDVTSLAAMQVVATHTGAEYGETGIETIFQYKDDTVAVVCAQNVYICENDLTTVIKTINKSTLIKPNAYGLYQGIAGYSASYDSFIVLYSGFTQIVLTDENGKSNGTISFNHGSYACYPLGEIEGCSEIDGMFYFNNNTLYRDYINTIHVPLSVSCIWEYSQDAIYPVSHFNENTYRYIRIDADSSASKFPLKDKGVSTVSEWTFRYGVNFDALHDMFSGLAPYFEIYSSNFVNDIMLLTNISAKVNTFTAKCAYSIRNSKIIFISALDGTVVNDVMGDNEGAITIYSTYSQLSFQQLLTSKPTGMSRLMQGQGNICTYAYNQTDNPITMMNMYSENTVHLKSLVWA